MKTYEEMIKKKQKKEEEFKKKMNNVGVLDKDKKEVVLVDALNCYIRSLFNVPVSRGDGTFLGGVFGGLNSILHVINKINPYRIIVIWDGKHASRERRKTYPKYKAQRDINRLFSGLKDMGKMDTIKEAKENFGMQRTMIKEALQKMGISQISKINGIEADDIAGIISEYIEDEDIKLIYYSTDYDWRQLVIDDNELYHPTKKQFIREEDFEIYPKNIAVEKCILGDSSDNIKGIKGIGKKTLYKIIPQLKEIEKRIDIDKLVDMAKDNIKKLDLTEHKKKLLKKMIKDKENMKKKYKVIKQPSDIINFNAKSQVHRQFDSIIKKEDFTPYISNMADTRMYLMKNGICSSKRFKSIRKRLLMYYSQKGK